MTDSVGTLTDYRWTRWAACAGVLFVLFLAVSFFLINTPNTGDSAAKIGHYYLTHKTKTNLTGLFTYLSVFFGVWFFTWLWRYFRSFPGLEVPAAVSLVGAVLFAASGALSAGINFAFADHTKQMNDGALVALNQLDNDLTYPMTIVGLALFYTAASVVIFRARAFPRWLAWVSGVLALASLVPPIAFFAFLATGIWVLIVSFLLWRMPVRSPVAEGPPIVS
jgi:hypothetical protein